MGTLPSNLSRLAHLRVQLCLLGNMHTHNNRSCTVLHPQIGMLLVRAHLPRRAQFPVQVRAREVPRNAKLPLVEEARMVWAWPLSTKHQRVVSPLQVQVPHRTAAQESLCTRTQEEHRKRGTRRRRFHLHTIRYSTKRWWRTTLRDVHAFTCATADRQAEERQRRFPFQSQKGGGHPCLHVSLRLRRYILFSRARSSFSSTFDCYHLLSPYDLPTL